MTPLASNYYPALIFLKLFMLDSEINCKVGKSFNSVCTNLMFKYTVHVYVHAYTLYSMHCVHLSHDTIFSATSMSTQS